MLLPLGASLNAVTGALQNITVSGGQFSKPYYTFSPMLNQLIRGETYRFTAQNIGQIHPFKINLPSGYDCSGQGCTNSLMEDGQYVEFTIP